MMQFNETWVVDFEFRAPQGERQKPVCLVAKCVETGELVRQWLEGENPSKPPYPIGENTLLIAYFASAEWRCYLNLGWELPQNTIDLYAEYRTVTNGDPSAGGRGLLAACSHYGIQTAADVYKEGMRDRILRGPPYSEAEKVQILDYCQTDVDATTELYRAMKPKIDLPRALLRGEYMECMAEMEYRGIPIDLNTFNRLQDRWDDLKLALVQEVNEDYQVYEGTKFKMDNFERFLIERGISWPRTEKGSLKTDDVTFRDMSGTYPELKPLRDLKNILGKLKLYKLAVGSDGRNRCLLSPFNTKTGRNSPSTAQFIFGSAKWLRSLIKPEEGKALAYIDYSQQEIMVAATLSKDQNMKEAYNSGDSYLAFAKLAGAAPEGATKATHREVRAAFKQCVLGTQYGMESHSLALRIGKTPAHAKELLRHHKRVFKDYWKWSEHVLNSALLMRKITTCMGWQCWTVGEKDKSIRNWPIQATGADILRVAAVMLRREGIHCVAPVHDALMIECWADEVDQVVPEAQRIMEDASEIVLGAGNRIRTDVDLIKYPDRYEDEDGKPTWDRIMSILEKLEEVKA